MTAMTNVSLNQKRGAKALQFKFLQQVARYATGSKESRRPRALIATATPLLFESIEIIVSPRDGSRKRAL